MCRMTEQEKKQYIKKLFKGYRSMSRSMERELEMLGMRVQRTKNHIKLYYNGKLFICSASATDFRSGRNLASDICRSMGA